jgi:hypothetical protein
MQFCVNGVLNDEAPKFLTSNPTALTHSITIANHANLSDPYTILLQLEGVVSFFEYALPTSAEFEDESIPHLDLTAAYPAWNPYDKDSASLEASQHDFWGNLISAVGSYGPHCWEATRD